MRDLGNGFFMDEYGQVDRSAGPLPVSAPARRRRRGHPVLKTLLVLGLLVAALAYASALVQSSDAARVPVTRAPTSATVRRGHPVILSYSVSDDARRVKVWVVVRTSKGRRVHRFAARLQPTATPLSLRFRCRLPRGRYRFLVYARDADGNVTTHPASNVLVVR